MSKWTTLMQRMTVSGGRDSASRISAVECPPFHASARERGAPLTREINLVNKLAAIPLVISVLATPALSFAQSATGLTRAQVVAELGRLEPAGDNPSTGEHTHTPAHSHPPHTQLEPAHPTL